MWCAMGSWCFLPKFLLCVQELPTPRVSHAHTSTSTGQISGGRVVASSSGKRPGALPQDRLKMFPSSDIFPFDGGERHISLVPSGILSYHVPRTGLSPMSSFRIYPTQRPARTLMKLSTWSYKIPHNENTQWVSLQTWNTYLYFAKLNSILNMVQ